MPETPDTPDELNPRVVASLVTAIHDTIRRRADAVLEPKDLVEILAALAAVSGYYLSPLGEESRRAFVGLVKEHRKRARAPTPSCRCALPSTDGLTQEDPMDKTQDGVPEEMLERANDLLGDLQAVVKGRFGNRLSDDDLTVVLNALSGVSGFYLSALSPQIVAEFNFSVLHHYCRARAQGVCTVMPTKLDG